MSQRQAGEAMGVSSWTVLNWEKGRTQPPVSAYPTLARFLGYEPTQANESLQQRMLVARQRNGWTISQAAKHMGIDASTWGAGSGAARSLGSVTARRWNGSLNASWAARPAKQGPAQAVATARLFNSLMTESGSVGFTRWWSKPASAVRRRSSFWPQPVRAASTVVRRLGCSRIRRATS